MEEYGIESVEVDPSLALYRYVHKSKASGGEVDVSFSAIIKSIQVVLRVSTHELATISSENVMSIELVRDDAGAGLRVIFDARDSTSEAKVIFEPEVSCRWWIVRNV
ncbi:hypothetical protein ACIPM0_18810 [Pseudomonas sichuanensis]|uniref:hypothetical protein n=1 Tax=Pseudomonas sichuanensis TaxID=2213015 RepID=UPI003817E29B